MATVDVKELIFMISDVAVHCGRGDQVSSQLVGGAEWKVGGA